MELPSASAPKTARSSPSTTSFASPTINRPVPPKLGGDSALNFNADSFMAAKSGGGGTAVARAAPVAARATTTSREVTPASTADAAPAQPPADEVNGAMFEPVPNAPSAPEPLPDTPAKP